MPQQLLSFQIQPYFLSWPLKYSLEEKLKHLKQLPLLLFNQRMPKRDSLSVLSNKTMVLNTHIFLINLCF
jgi:hypothetical protein